MGHESYDLENFGMSGSKEFLKFIVIDELSNYTKVRSVNSNTNIYRKESYFGRFNYNYRRPLQPLAGLPPRWLQPLP